MSQKSLLKVMLRNEENITDEVLDYLLETSKNMILAKRYPFGNYPTNEAGETILEDRYLNLQLRVSVEIYAKEGAEGETSHVENGVTRNYGSASSSTLLKEVVPLSKVI